MRSITAEGASRQTGIRMPWLLRTLRLPTIPEVSSQEYHNEAFVPDTASPTTESTGGATIAKGDHDRTAENTPEVGARTSLSLPFRDNGHRRSSIVDIAFALNPALDSSTPEGAKRSLPEPVLPTHFRRGNYFRHPFGDTATILEELFALEKDSDMTYMKSGTASPAKLVIWIVFTLFMVAVAGAIILGAESFKGQTQSTNSTYPVCNSTGLPAEPS